jgi:hypothetical protein
MSRYTRWVPILFIISLFFLGTHVIDDALFLNEPADWGVSVPEFLFIVASIYLIIPPLGAALARRGMLVGFVIVMGYAFQAFYGGGVNHMRHLQGEFGGLGTIARFLTSLGVDCLNMQGRGFVTGLAAMVGCGVTSPHTHTWWSNTIAATNIILNVPLIALCIFAIIRWRREQIPNPKSQIPNPSPITNP